jgi:tripartite-type tricarboxylate transporter receptor subunit TctC
VLNKRRLMLAVALFALVGSAAAQDYPNRIITLVSPYPPGGPSDTTARLIIGPMEKVLGEKIIVENITGAGGTIGTNKVAKAAPDGYTLVISGSGNNAAAEFLRKDLPYRSTDFEQIGLINTSPMLLVARAGLPPNTLKEFIAYLKTHEKTLTEADAGVGSITNLACSIFHSVAGVHPTVASYRGAPQITMDMLAGNVDFACNTIVATAPQIKAGKLKAYAVTGDKRSPMLPNVPTTAEAGLPKFNLTIWFGLSAPKGTPRPIVEKLNKALGAALDDPAVVKRFADLGYTVVPPEKRSPEYFDKFYKTEVALWAKVLGGLHVKQN